MIPASEINFTCRLSDIAPDKSFIFSKCQMCKRIHPIIDGRNYQYLDGCHHDFRTTHYNMEKAKKPEVLHVKRW